MNLLDYEERINRWQREVAGGCSRDRLADILEELRVAAWTEGFDDGQECADRFHSES